MRWGRLTCFPGCISTNLYPSIERSTRLVLEELGFELVYLPFGCCPPPGVLRSYDEPTWATLAARNLAIAARQGLPVLTICNGCFGSLAEAVARLGEDPELERRIVSHLDGAGVAGGGGAAGVEVLHILDVLGTAEAKKALAERVVHRLDVPGIHRRGRGRGRPGGFRCGIGRYAGGVSSTLLTRRRCFCS